MATATMSKKKEDVPGDEPESTLKVWRSDQQIVAKVAAHRGLTIKELFREQDVQDFFKHLLLAEMQKEAERLQGKPKR